MISIHAPRTGSDAYGALQLVAGAIISIHAPRTGSDFRFVQHLVCALLFQSTLPARGATVLSLAELAVSSDFNPRSPHGERPFGLGAIRAGADFNPRSPHGERRCKPVSAESCDLYFNPRSPHGERPTPSTCFSHKYLFQSTLPARGATLENSSDKGS